MVFPAADQREGLIKTPDFARASYRDLSQLLEGFQEVLDQACGVQPVFIEGWSHWGEPLALGLLLSTQNC